MLDWTPTPISARRRGRLLWPGVITVVLVTALAGPAIAVPWSAAGPNLAADEAGRSSQWTAQPPLRQARGGLGVAKVRRQILAIGGFEVVDDVATVFDVVEGRRIRAVGDGVPWRPCRRPGPTWPPPRWAGWCTRSEVSVGPMTRWTSWRRSTRGRVVGRRASPFHNHAMGPERRAWMVGSTSPVGSSFPGGPRTR